VRGYRQQSTNTPQSVRQHSCFAFIILSLAHSFTGISTLLHTDSLVGGTSCTHWTLHSLNEMTRLQQKKRAPFRPTIVRAGEVRDCASDYEVALKKAGIKPAAYEEVFSLMVRFRDFGPNEAMFKRGTTASSKYVALRFLKMFGERVWGNNRKHIRSGLPNGGFRYTPAKQNRAQPNRNESKLVAILASAFREMRRRMFGPTVSP
jgi:hypothetical protein